jgi:hypothetical protein
MATNTNQRSCCIKSQLHQLSHIDISAELQAHQDLAAYNQRVKDIAELEKLIACCVADEAREQKTVEKLKAEIAELEAHKCYACGQEFHDGAHETVLETKRRALQESALQALATNGQWIENTDALRALGELGTRPTTHYKTEAEAIRHSSELENLQQKIAGKSAEVRSLCRTTCQATCLWNWAHRLSPTTTQKHRPSNTLPR